MARTKRKDTELAKRIGRIMRENRLSRGFTQAVLAEKISLEAETISRMENGIRLPSIEKLFDISEELGISITTFFDETDKLKARPDASLYSQRFDLAIKSVSDVGRIFLLEVAENYARDHARCLPKNGKISG